MNFSNSKTTCKDSADLLPDLLLDPASVPDAVAAHVASCPPCTEELTSLRSTFAMLDEWKAPEPTPYFNTRLYARVREAQAAPPEGFFERKRSFVLFSTGRQLRPALAGALALVLVISGGSFVGIHGLHGFGVGQASAAVDDLKLMDNNAQALQQMDQLLDDNDDDTPPAS